MTPAQLTRWRARLKISQERAAQLMGISRRQYIRYETGDAEIPKLVDLATKALKHSEGGSGEEG